MSYDEQRMDDQIEGGMHLQKQLFLEQTSIDYDIPYEEAERIYDNNRELFYEKLEEYIKERANDY